MCWVLFVLNIRFSFVETRLAWESESFVLLSETKLFNLTGFYFACP